MRNCAGNDNLHWLTSDTRQRLRVDLADFSGNSRYAEYDDFRVGSAEEKYRLDSVGTYRGTAGQETARNRHDIRYWHCPQPMRSTVHATVGRPSVRLSHQAAADLLLWAR